MKAYYNIYLTIDDVRVWMNKYTSKLSYSFSNNLCSTSWKSVTDTASVKLVFNDRNVAELSEIVSALIAAQQAFPPKEIGFEALNEDESKTIFKGVLDLGKLSIESAKLPGSISLSAKSPIDKLDKKPNTNFVLYPATVQDAVERCIFEAGLDNGVDWRCSVGSKQMEVPFVVTDEDSDTWRDKIDTLLAEIGGCTLAFDHSEDKFYVFKVNDADKAFSDVPVNYHVQTKLKSSTTKFAKDGVVVSYGNLKTSKDQTIYWHDISLSDEDNLKPKGDIIKPGVYYPFDSDIQKTYEEYEANLLDYGQLIGNVRKANEHITLYYVDPASTKVTIVASDMNGKGVNDWYENATFISPEGGFTYPAGGEFYPRKAWLSFKNKTEKDINITRFSISGDTYYSDAEYRIVMPLDCKEPEEYSSKYIANTDTAKDFANYLMNLKRFGSDTSTWTERWEDHNLGDKVRLMHKGGNMIDAVIVRKESVVYGDELWAKMTAVSIDGWSFEQPALVQGNAMSTSLLDPYENAKRNGYTGSREQWESRNDIFYLWSSSETELKPKKRAFWKLGGKWMLFANLPVGDFGMQDWMNSWSEVMAERTEEYNYLWAKVGEDGEPFLLQGVSPMDFSFVVSPSNYVVNPRNLSDITLTITLSRQNGIKGASSLEFVGTHTGITLTKAEGDDVWTVSIAQRSNTSLSFKVSATIGKVTKVLEIAGQLVGNEAKCIGWVSELPQYTQEGLNLIEGDTCILNGTPMIFNGSSWDTVNDISSLPYEMGVAIGNTALFSGNNITQSMSILWAFIQNLYTQSALIEHLRTHLIELSTGGVIKSEGYTPGGNKKGFYLNNDGTFECYDGTFKGTLDGAKGRFTGQLETITLKTVLGGESSYPVGAFTTVSSLLSSLDSVQQGLGVDIKNKTFKAGGTLSGFGTIVSISVSQIYSEYKTKSYYNHLWYRDDYKWESARITWLTLTFANSNGDTAMYVVRKVYRKISHNIDNSTPNYPTIPDAPSSISELVNTDDYYFYDAASTTKPDVDNAESVWNSVGLARNESLSVSNLTVYNNTQERMYIENLPTTAPSESNRIWRDSSGYLRIV